MTIMPYSDEVVWCDICDMWTEHYGDAHYNDDDDEWDSNMIGDGRRHAER